MAKKTIVKTTKKTYRTYTRDGYNWIDMGSTPLKYPVHGDGADKKKVVIKAGTRNVQIAFGQSFMKWWDDDAGRYRKMNVYNCNGQIVHGH